MTTREQLLAKFYRGDCTRQELQLLLVQLQESKDEDYSGIMSELWAQLNDHPELDEPTAARILGNTLSKIEDGAAQRQSPGIRDGRFRSRKNLFRRLSVAAVLLVLIAVASWILWPAGPSIEIHTAYGEQRTITLPDQSTVKLNANSSISFYENWEEEAVRQVWLEGEAYFQVTKHPEAGKKFQVITRDLTVEVLGTVFNVNTREEATMVFLEEGKVQVALEKTEEDILMDPGELVTYSVKTQRSEKRKVVEEEAPASWKDGTILLQNVSLKTIMAKMEEIYGIDTRVEHEQLLERTYYFPMPINNLDTAFLLLKESTGLVIEKNDNELVVK